MSEKILIQNCSPTLAGLKTGNIFSCSFECVHELKNSIRRLNRLLTRKGLRLIPLRIHGTRALIYLFRPARLAQDLKNSSAAELLRALGYEPEHPDKCVRHLIERIGEKGDFPHEIGLFLGYPPEDVIGFIENKADGSKLVGCWKVYGDVEAAQRLFKKYKKCTDIYCSRHALGRPLEKLAVACRI